jgi:hypothetical protein
MENDLADLAVRCVGYVHRQQRHRANNNDVVFLVKENAVRESRSVTL